MSVYTTVKLTREEARILANFWLDTYECLTDEEYDESRDLVNERIYLYDNILDDLSDNDTAVEQLKRI